MRFLVACCLLCLMALPARAEAQRQLSFYGSAGSALASELVGSDPGGLGSFSFSGDWDAGSTAGMRITWWRHDDLGIGVDFNTFGVSATDQTLAANGLGALGLEDGLGLLTVNAFRRWKLTERAWSPYIGAGLGLAVPNVVFDGGGTPTSDRQLTGPAVQFIAGASMPIGGQFSLFGEYQSSLSVNMAELASGGSLDTQVIGGGLNVGVSLGF